MLHFVRQLQYFCHQEVIECSWAALSTFVDKGEGDLDALIEAHTSYINRLASKGLLRAVSRKGNAAEEDGIMTAVREAFKQTLKFAESLDALCNHALSEAARLDDRGSLRSVSSFFQSDALYTHSCWLTPDNHLAASRDRFD
jgi:gamma-tubulin complex component 3